MSIAEKHLRYWVSERIQHYEGIEFNLTAQAFERGIEVGEVRGTLDALYQMQDLLKNEV